MASPRADRARTAVLGRLGASALAFAAAAGAARAQDPFQPGLRWTEASDLAAPAIPRAVAFAAEGNVAWSAWSGANAGFGAASAHAVGPTSALARATAPTGASGSTGVAAGSGPWIFALAQVPAPDAWHRRTEVAGGHVDDVAAGSTLATRWTRALPFAANGAARIATDALGASAWVAAFDDATGRVRVERLDAASGAVLAAVELVAAGLQELAVAADGSRAVLSAGLDLYVVDAQLAVRHHAALAATTTALAIAGDGATVAHGAPGSVRVLRDVGGFALTATISAGASELAARAALDENGDTLALGWWTATTGIAWRFEVRDLGLGTAIEQRAFNGVAGGLQDLPTAVALTPDGARAAFACWGTGSTAPEVAIWDRASDAYVLEADLPGSAFALSLDATGTRALVAAKSTHANVLSSTGSVRLLDTGERDLQVLGAPIAGGTLHLAARYAGATSVLFLTGELAPAPFRVPGVAGQLSLRRVGLGVERLGADATGRADSVARIPLDPAQIGTVRRYQAAFRGPFGTRFGRSVLGVRIL